MWSSTASHHGLKARSEGLRESEDSRAEPRAAITELTQPPQLLILHDLLLPTKIPAPSHNPNRPPIPLPPLLQLKDPAPWVGPDCRPDCKPPEQGGTNTLQPTGVQARTVSSVILSVADTDRRKFPKSFFDSAQKERMARCGTGCSSLGYQLVLINLTGGDSGVCSSIRRRWTLDNKTYTGH